MYGGGLPPFDHTVPPYRKPFKSSGQKALEISARTKPIWPSSKHLISVWEVLKEDMVENRRPTINSILKDPAASDWLKAAVRSALDCDPADVMRDAQTLVTLMIGYTSRFGYPARRQWPRKKVAP